VIPRVPDAPVDADNARTSALAASIRDLGEVRGRAVADVYSLFEALPDVFDNYYYYTPEVQDPVGHPNSAGYTEMAGLMLETVLALLETPTLQVLAPAGPITTGTVVAFQAVADEAFSWLEWDFGDGGWAASSQPLDLEVEHVYFAPGTYTVSLRGETTAGGQVVDEVDVEVTGGAAAWAFRTTLIPLALRGDGSEATDLLTDLRLQNFGARWLDVEALLVPEISFDQPPSPRRVMVAPGTAVIVPDVVGTLFGLTHARGALLLTGRVEPGGSTSSLVPVATLSIDGAGGGSSDTVDEVASNSWSSVQKVIGGISGSASTAIELAVANVDTQGGYVQLDLVDAQGAPVDSALFELGPAEIRFRVLTDLFRGLESRPQPFTAIFRASGARFVASALAVDPGPGQVVYLHGSP
jgi:PKD repeat protein